MRKTQSRLPGVLLLLLAAGVALLAPSSVPAQVSAPSGAELAAPAEARESSARVVSPDTTFFAEGLAADPRDGTLLVTSVRHRNVLVVPPHGPTRWLWTDTGAVRSVAAVFGVALDTARSTLWLSTAPIAHMAARPNDADVRAELLKVSYPDGAILDRFVLGDGLGTPGEITLAPDGTVFVSDGAQGLLYRHREGASTLETVRHAGLRSPQGIAVLPDTRVAYVADWSRGLLRWDLETDSLVAVPAADGRLLRGVDGLRWHDGALIAIQNGAVPNRLLRVQLDTVGTTITSAEVLDVPDPIEGEMTVGVVLGSEFIYVSSSVWPFWSEVGERRSASRALPPVVLRALRLSR